MARQKWGREISLSALSAELPLGYNGVTISVKDDNDPQRRSGKLRIGRAIYWTDAGKGRKKPKRITWEKLIEILRSQP
jgi:hypothetical protein